jgi:hypothetical protein
VFAVAACGAAGLGCYALWAWAATVPAGCEVRFRDIAHSAGVAFVLDNAAGGDKHQIETMTGGAAVADFDGDGRLDIFFVNGAALPGMEKTGPQFWNRLYRNEGGGRFRDVTERAGVCGRGYGMGVAVADFDNDGHEDLFVTGPGANQLLRNRGDGTFEDVTERAGLRQKGDALPVAAGWFDYNNDGYLDLLIVNYIHWSIKNEPACNTNNIRAYCSPNSYEGAASQLFRNNGDGTFTDISEASGIGRIAGKGMGVAFADYDGDGWTDVMIANDTYRNLLFHNNGNGTFTEAGVMAGVAYNDNGKPIAGMGVDFRDVFGTGRPDVFITGTLHDTFPLYQNMGGGFADRTAESRLAALTENMTAWGNGIYDFDNDGWKDLFTANAAILDNSELIDHRPYKLPDTVFRNLGTGRFNRCEVTPPAAHRGAAFGDLNGDGRVDAVVNVLNGPPEVLVNESGAGRHWLVLELEGTRSNRDGLGARVEVTAGGRRQFNHATTSVGYGSASDRRVHFGLGAAARVETVEIRWPSGTRQTLRDIPADRVMKVVEPR